MNNWSNGEYQQELAVRQIRDELAKLKKLEEIVYNLTHTLKEIQAQCEQCEYYEEANRMALETIETLSQEALDMLDEQEEKNDITR